MINRKQYCVANLKMNLFGNQIMDYISELDNLFDGSNNNKINTIICPSVTSLSIFFDHIRDSNYCLGAQNIHHKEYGAYTGEVSINMISDFIKFVILGHSERRQYFNETNEIIHKKIMKVSQYNLNSILCVGETLDQRNNNEVKKTLKNQLSRCLQGVKSQVIIAYEPVWAIGTGETATSEIITEAHQMIRNILNDIGFDGQKISILYGGSVNRNNAKELIALADVDGFLIGGASLDVNHFYDIYKFIEESV